MAAPWETPRTCNTDGCTTRVILARRTQSSRWMPFEAIDRPPFSDLSVGCWVLVNGVAWKPRHLMEHLVVSREISETAARELMTGWPWHRPHLHTEPLPAGITHPAIPD